MKRVVPVCGSWQRGGLLLQSWLLRQNVQGGMLWSRIGHASAAILGAQRDFFQSWICLAHVVRDFLGPFVGISDLFYGDRLSIDVDCGNWDLRVSVEHSTRLAVGGPTCDREVADGTHHAAALHRQCIGVLLFFNLRTFHCGEMGSGE